MPKQLPPAEAFADRISTVMEELGVTKRELSARLGYPEATVGRWSNGRNLPSSESLADIARKLNVSADWLLGLSEHRTLDPSLPGAPTEDIKHLRARAARADDLEAGLAAIGKLVKESPGGMELLVEKLGRAGPGGSRGR